MDNAFILTETGGTVFVNGKSYVLDRTHPNYPQVKDALNKKEWVKVESLLNVVQAVKSYVGKNFNVENGQFFFKGEVVHNAVVDKILNFMKEELDPTPLVNFLDKLLQNPSKRSVDSLYNFLEKHGFPITEDGCFIAYKKVRDDYLDYYSGKVSNRVGQKPSMARNKIDDDPNKGCSYGFHAGSLNYASNEYYPGQGRLVVVKVNPADVVSVPHDCNFQKLRMWQYEVLSDYTDIVKQEDLVDKYHKLYPEKLQPEDLVGNDITFFYHGDEQNWREVYVEEVKNQDGDWLILGQDLIKNDWRNFKWSKMTNVSYLDDWGDADDLDTEDEFQI